MIWQKYFDNIINLDWGSKESVAEFELLMDHCNHIDHDAIVFDTWQHYYKKRMLLSSDYETFKDISTLNIETLSLHPYHNPTHISQVLLTCLLFWEKSNLSADILRALYCAALGHDILHDGIGNKDVDFKLETIAAEKIKSILMKNHWDDNSIYLIESLILSTEAKYRFALKTNQNELKIAQFNFIYSKKEYLEAARIISDADLFCSLGLGEDLHMEQTFKVLSELNTPPSKRHEISLYFLNNISGEKFLSKPAQVFNHNLLKLHNYYETEFMENT